MVIILVAEDERRIRDSFVDILVYAGYDVIEAEDGRTAFEVALREHPDLILLDLMLPVMDGFEVMKKLRESPTTEATPVVVLTALPPAEAEQETLRLGAAHYIAKPCDIDRLELTVKLALREARTAAEEEVDASKVWYGRTLNSQESQGLIRTADLLTPLEKKLNGGIPLGSLTLVEGATAAGKSVVCQHLTYGALADGHCTAYFTSEHTIQSFAKQMGSIGLGVTKPLSEGQLSIYPIEESSKGQDSVPLLGALERDIAALSDERELIVVDAITNLVDSGEGQAVIEFFSSLRRSCNKGRAIIVVSNSYAFDESMSIRLSALCDTHLRLRAGKIKDKVVRKLEVVKVNDVELDTDNIISFEVESGTGIRIIPFSQAKA